MKIEKIKQELETQGFVLIGYGAHYNADEFYWRFIHKDTFQLICVMEECVDDEEFFNAAFNKDVEEIMERINVRHDNRLTKEALETKSFDWEDEDLREVMKELIKENEVHLPEKQTKIDE